jgi:hypothetical protein
VTARETALRIAAIYGWEPTTDPQQMGTIPEKVAWDVVMQVENLLNLYAFSWVPDAAATDVRLRSQATDGNPPEATMAQAAPGMGHSGSEYACCCNGEGKCGYCAEQAACSVDHQFGHLREGGTK